MGTPSGRARAGIGALAGVVLVGGVLLTRGSTAATDADLAPPSPPPTAEPEVERVEREVLEATGMGQFQLGSAVSEDGGNGWYNTGLTSRDGGCRYLQAMWPQDGHVQTAGWAVRGQVVSVVLRSYAPGTSTVPSELGVSFGDGVESAALLPGAVPATEEVPGLGRLRTVTVPSESGSEVVLSDLGEDAGISYIEVREPAGRDCVADFPWVQPSTGPPPELPVLDAAGRGPLRFGQPEGDLAALGLVESEGSEMGAPGCTVWHVDGLTPPEDGVEGLSHVFVRDGVVVGMSLYAGRTSEGLFVGAPLTAVLDTYPEASLDGTDGLGTWQPLADGRLLRVQSFQSFRVPHSVDVEVATDQRVVGALSLLSRSCSG